MLKKGHQQGGEKTKCQFTPSSMLSPSSIKRVVEAVSSGSLKSLAGLDDEDVEKGYENWKKLREIAQKLCVILGKHDSEEAKELQTNLTDAQTFHETSFKDHVKECGEHICQCINCGFTSSLDRETCVKVPTGSKASKKKNKPEKGECRHPGCTNKAITFKRGLCTKHDKEFKNKKEAGQNQQPKESQQESQKAKKKTPPKGRLSDYVPCHLRASGNHKPPCLHCEQSFEIFSKLLRLVKQAQSTPGRSKREMQEYHDLENEVIERRENLIELRSHIVRKKNEDNVSVHI